MTLASHVASEARSIPVAIRTLAATFVKCRVCSSILTLALACLPCLSISIAYLLECIGSLLPIQRLLHIALHLLVDVTRAVNH